MGTCLSKRVRKETREASLRRQIDIIPRTWLQRRGQRALSNTRSELREVRHEARALKRDETSLARALKRTLFALEQEEQEAKKQSSREGTVGGATASIT